MKKKDSKIICQVSALAGKNPEIYKQIVQICQSWTDNKCNALLEAYEYLTEHRPEDVGNFMNMLKYLAEVETNYN